MKYTIKKIDIWTTGVFLGLFYAILSFIPVVFSFFVLFMSIMNGRFETGMVFVLLMPLAAFIGGFASGVLYAFIYNLIAQNWQGVKLDIGYNEEHED